MNPWSAASPPPPDAQRLSAHLAQLHRHAETKAARWKTSCARLMNPLLKAWLDEHLPAIVQAKVEEEVERIARRRIGRRPSRS